MSARGITLLELLVAGALVALVGGVVAALAEPLRYALARSDGNFQLEPAGRAVIDAIAADVREAGADAAVADRRWRMAAFAAAASPLRDVDATDPVPRGSAVRLRRTPLGGAQAVLRTDVPAGRTVLLLDTTARCAGGPPSCSFRAGDACLLYSDAAAELVTIFAVGGGTIVLTRPLANAFPLAAVLAALATTTYGTRNLVDGSRQLVRVSTGGSEQPVLDNVVDFETMTDTADLSQTSRLTLRLRLEAPSSSLRGPVGYLFRRAGSAAHANAWLPDVELSVSVALRNPTGG